MTLTLQAPAKVNLSLRILRRREDGFHEIETLMVPLDLCDELRISRAGSTTLTCSDPSLPTDSSNLVLRALAALEAKVGRALSLRIHLEKKIPHGAGLGGGSSDAASLLSGANTLFDLGLARSDLAEIAGVLGSDVPFFLDGKAAWCRGRGERVEPLEEPLPSGMSLLLAKPEFGIPTPWAYQHWSGSRELSAISYLPISLDWGEMVNDLERPVFEKYPVLADMKDWLSSRSEVSAAVMSGSGSTMMALLAQGVTEGPWDALQAALRKEFGETLWITTVGIGA